MRRPFRIFELSKSEQRVVLIVMFVLIAIAFAKYERRIHQSGIQRAPVSATKTSPSPVENR